MRSPYSRQGLAYQRFCARRPLRNTPAYPSPSQRLRLSRMSSRLAPSGSRILRAVLCAPTTGQLPDRWTCLILAFRVDLEFKRPTPAEGREYSDLHSGHRSRTARRRPQLRPPHRRSLPLAVRSSTTGVPIPVAVHTHGGELDPTRSVLSVLSIGDQPAEFRGALAVQPVGLTLNPSISCRPLCLLHCPGHSCA
jgi:hypothetical protein